MSDILGGNVDTAALSAALNHFIKYPSGPLAVSLSVSVISCGVLDLIEMTEI